MGIWFVKILAVVNVVAINFSYKYKFRQKVMVVLRNFYVNFVNFILLMSLLFSNIVPVNHTF